MRQIKITNRPILILIFMIGTLFAVNRKSIKREPGKAKGSKSKERKFA
jgi:hypothetical protein